MGSSPVAIMTRRQPESCKADNLSAQASEVGLMGPILRGRLLGYESLSIRAVAKIMVPFWVLSIIRHLVFGGPERGP